MASDEEILLGLRRLRWQMFSREFKRELRYHVAFATWWIIEQTNAKEFLRQYIEVQAQQAQRRLETVEGGDTISEPGLHYRKLDDSDPPLQVVDFTEGGPEPKPRYEWMPKGEIWMENDDGQRPSPCGSDTACSGAAAAGDS